MENKITIRIAYIGLDKTGKTSIIKYLFQNMKAEDTMNLEST